MALNGWTVLITGGTDGIGLATALALAESGARAIITSRHLARAQAVAQAPPGLVPMELDLADSRKLAADFQKIVAAAGPIDAIVANAAARDRRPLGAIQAEDFVALLQTNLVASFELARLASASMIERKRGRLVFISAAGATRARPNNSSYAASKGAIEALVRSLAAELGRHGITANAVAPGFVATATNAKLATDDRFIRLIQEDVALQRRGTPEEIANVVRFLVSDDASYISGQVILVDGGMSASLCPGR
jgi:NAD(P)-dependent dehydrogenase (short-subunit alcohol dehydrogenase family)